MIDLTKCYTTTQAAKILKIKNRSVSSYISRGLIKGDKIGRDWFINISEIERFQRERRPVGRPEK